MSKDDIFKKNSFYLAIDNMRYKKYIEDNLKAIHNKDYSVVKTFRAAPSRCRPLLFLEIKNFQKIHSEPSEILSMLFQFFRDYFSTKYG